jgi:hypothetical protein
MSDNNNSLSTATNIGTILLQESPPRTEIYSRVGGINKSFEFDRNDYYKFVVDDVLGPDYASTTIRLGSWIE